MDSIIDDVEMMRSGDKSVPCHAIGYYNVWWSKSHIIEVEGSATWRETITFTTKNTLKILVLHQNQSLNMLKNSNNYSDTTAV